MENLRIALRALAANKLRSGLTMLGIITPIMLFIMCSKSTALK